MSELFQQLHLGQGAYTDMADLIRLRHASRQLVLHNRNKTSNPLSGILSSNVRGRGIDFSEVRHYEPGDDVRSIDWKVTARTQVPHTKMFQEERERPVLILVDQSQSMFFGSSVSFKSLIAAQLAALIAWLSLNKGDRVGGIVFSEDYHREVRPKRNKHSVLQLLHEVHEFNHKLDRQNHPSSHDYLSNALLSSRRVAKHGSSIFILSDFQNLNEDALRHLRQLSQHNDLHGFHIFDDLEQELPQPDIYQITNGQERMQINTISKKSREQYRENYLDQKQLIKTEFDKIKAPFVSLATTESPIAGIQRLQRVMA